MNKITCLFLLFLPVLAGAHKKKGYSLLCPSIVAQQYIENNSIKYNTPPIYTKIAPKNTIGHTVKLQYERQSKYGLVFGCGLHYGYRDYNIIMTQNISNFDPNAIRNLSGVTYEYGVRAKINFWGYNVFAGYRIQILPKTHISVKGGIALRLFYDGLWENHYEGFAYYDDDFLVLHGVLMATEKQFGRDPTFEKRGLLGRNRFPKGYYYLESYVGLEREINRSVLKNISLGIEFTSAGKRDQISFSTQIIESTNRTDLNMGRYYDYNVSMGLRLSVGLWK